MKAKALFAFGLFEVYGAYGSYAHAYGGALWTWTGRVVCPIASLICFGAAYAARSARREDAR